jgi:hypothetical protein
MDDETSAYLTALRQRLAEDTRAPEAPLRQETIVVMGTPALVEPFIGVLRDPTFEGAPAEIGMTHGMMDISENGATLQLLGTVSREKIGFLWDILGPAVLGFVILLDNADDDGRFTALKQQEALNQRGPDKPRVYATQSDIPAEDRDSMRLPEDVEPIRYTPDDPATVRAVVLALVDAIEQR